MGVSEGEEKAILAKVYEIVLGACEELRGPDAHLLVARSAAAVTLFRHRGAPIQMILNTFVTVEELLAGFDVDCACCVYAMSTGTFQWRQFDV